MSKDRADARSLPKAAQEERRRIAFQMYDDGHPMTVIARALHMSYGWICKIVTNRKQHGMDAAITGGTRGRPVGSNRLLTPKQEEKIRQLVIDNQPYQLKFDFALWTRASVRDLIKMKTGVELALSTVGMYLRRWGMTPQRPGKSSYQRDSDGAVKWITEDYPAIEQRCKAVNGLIFFQDETAICQDSNTLRGYSPKGQTPILVENKRAHYSCGTLCSAINAQGKVFFMLKPYKAGANNGFNSSDFLDFLKGLLADQKKLQGIPPGSKGRKLFVICDNHRMHKTKLVTDWVAAHEDEIELCFLPPYNPQLNPQEIMNQALKNDIRQRARRTVKQLNEHVEAFMNALCVLPELVQSFFCGKLVLYAADENFKIQNGGTFELNTDNFEAMRPYWAGQIRLTVKTPFITV